MLSESYNAPEQPSVDIAKVSSHFPESYAENISISLFHPRSISGNGSKIEYDLFQDDVPQHQTQECLTNNFIEWAISISNLLTVVNSAANFLIYMLRGKKFRDIFLQTYFRRCMKSRPENPYRTNGKHVTFTLFSMVHDAINYRYLFNQISPFVVSDSVIPGQAHFTGNKSYTGARFTAMGTNYNTTTSRLESEFTAEQTGKLA